MHPTAPLLALVLTISASVTAFFSSPRGEVEEARLALRERGITADSESFFDALDRGDRQVARWLIDLEVNPHAVDEKGRTLLMAAVSARMPAVAEKLIERGVMIEVADQEGGTALTYAVRSGEASIVKDLLERGVDPDTEIPGGGGLVVEAIATGRTASAKLLWEAGASKWARDAQGTPAIFHATMLGSDWVVKNLLASGVMTDARDAAGDTVMHKLVQRGHTRLLPLLWSHGADMNQTNAGGETPLHVALMAGHSDLLPVLVNHGASVDRPFPSGSKPLHLAIQRSDAAFLQAILKQNVDPNEKAPDGRTPIELALAKRDFACAQLLLDYQALAPGNALYNAVVEGDQEAFRFLLKNGANPDPERSDPPLLAAIRGGHGDMVAALLKAEASPSRSGKEKQSALHLAVAMNDEALTKTLLEHGADPNVAFNDNITESFKEKIRDGGYIRWQFTKDSRITPLMMAADGGNHKLAQVLLEHGANTNVWTRRRSYYPIGFAARRDDVKMMQVILGRDPAAKNRWVKVDLSEQKVWVYDENNNTILTTKVSTGKKGYRTKTGEFVITNKARHHVSNLYDAKMPYFQRLSCGDFGFHEGYVPSYPASHGCLRVPKGDVYKLWQLTKVGDKVVIVP